jgi:hypothetical protein
VTTRIAPMEDWEDAPEGTPRGPRYAWWRLRGEYDAGA